jgi:hypothetical protein
VIQRCTSLEQSGNIFSVAVFCLAASCRAAAVATAANPKAARRAARTATMGGRGGARRATTAVPNSDEDGSSPQPMREDLDMDAEVDAPQPVEPSAIDRGTKRSYADMVGPASTASTGSRTKQCRLCGIWSSARNPFTAGKLFERWGALAVPWASGTPDHPVGRFCNASIKTYSVAGFEDHGLFGGWF